MATDKDALREKVALLVRETPGMPTAFDDRAARAAWATADRILALLAAEPPVVVPSERERQQWQAEEALGRELRDAIREAGMVTQRLSGKLVCFPSGEDPRFRAAVEMAAEVADAWAASYPTSVFPPDGDSVDAASAKMGRHVATHIAAEIRALSEYAVGSPDRGGTHE